MREKSQEHALTRRLTIEKDFDAASPYPYKAIAKGQTLQSAELATEWRFPFENKSRN